MHKLVLSQFSLNVNTEAERPKDDAMFKFVFLRHPFERLVSAYYDKFVQDPGTTCSSCECEEDPDRVRNCSANYFLGDFLLFGQAFKVGGNNYFTQIAHIVRQFSSRCLNYSFF